MRGAVLCVGDGNVTLSTMTAATYKEIITEGIEDLSADGLAEIHQVALQTDLKKFSHASTDHLEEEWKDYAATIAAIYARQNARHHQPRTREEVDAL